jgi:NAD(P)H-hydrate epimerase
MSLFWSLERIRSVDRIAMERFLIPSLLLMENAGRGAADWIIEEMAAWAPVVILCGTGNNGGDGLVIARHLHAARIPLCVWLVGDPARMTPDTATNFAILSKTRISSKWLALDAEESAMVPLRLAIDGAGMIIDAFLGTGAKGSPRGAMANAIEASNGTTAQRIAIDVPSGLDGRTGLPSTPTFRAHTTLTFVAPKIGFESTNASPYIGRVEVLPIGVPPEVIEAACSENR